MQRDDFATPRLLFRLFRYAAAAGDTAKIQAIGADAQKAQEEYRRLASKIGFKECGGGT